MRRRRAAALLALTLALGGCGESELAPPEAAPPPASPPPAATGSDPVEPAPGNRLPQIGRIPAGHYTSSVFMPTVTFDLGEGWQAYQPEAVDVLLFGKEGKGVSFLNPARWEGVIDPSREWLESPLPPEALQPVPDDLLRWSLDHPRYESSEPAPAFIGGAAGFSIDQAVVSGYQYEGCPAACVLLYEGSGGVAGSIAGYLERNIFLDVDGVLVVINVSAPAEEFEEFLAEAQLVLATVTFASPGSA